MKIVKALLGIILMLVLLFLAIGIIRPSVSYENEVIINQPTSVVWAVMTDPTKLADWLDGYQRTELISGEPGTVGAVTSIFFVQNGKEVVIKETITQVVPNDMIAMDFENEFMNMEYQIEIKNVDNKSRVSSKTIAKGSNLFSRSMVGLMKGVLSQQENTNLSKLKALAESQG